MTKIAVFSAITALAFSALPASAQTADNLVKRLAPPPSVSVAPNPLSWGGFYVGAGYGREKNRSIKEPPIRPSSPGGPGLSSNDRSRWQQQTTLIAVTSLADTSGSTSGSCSEPREIIHSATVSRHQFRSGRSPATAASERPAIISAEARPHSAQSRRGGMCAG